MVSSDADKKCQWTSNRLRFPINRLFGCSAIGVALKVPLKRYLTITKLAMATGYAMLINLHHLNNTNH
jgi:hypothetical protein